MQFETRYNTVFLFYLKSFQKINLKGILKLTQGLQIKKCVFLRFCFNHLGTIRYRVQDDFNKFSLQKYSNKDLSGKTSAWKIRRSNFKIFYWQIKIETFFFVFIEFSHFFENCIYFPFFLTIRIFTGKITISPSKSWLGIHQFFGELGGRFRAAYAARWPKAAAQHISPRKRPLSSQKN